MSDLNELTKRLDAEFGGFRQKIEEFQAAAKGEYEAREARFHELFVPAVGHVVDLIRPRLEVLVERFRDRVNVKPMVSEHMREVTIKFNSPLARIDLKYRLSHDADVKNLVLDQHLELLPILMKYEPHASLTMPLDKIDDAKITQWFDDRIVEFVQTVGALHRNQYYLKGISSPTRWPASSCRSMPPKPRSKRTAKRTTSSATKRRTNSPGSAGSPRSNRRIEYGEGEAPAEPRGLRKSRLSRSFAHPPEFCPPLRGCVPFLGETACVGFSYRSV